VIEEETDMALQPDRCGQIRAGAKPHRPSARRMRRRDRVVDRVGVERPAVALGAERARVEGTRLGDGRSKLRSRAQGPTSVGPAGKHEERAGDQQSLHALSIQTSPSG
jgi:hypothetical protein